jgi:hypothetical protein
MSSKSELPQKSLEPLRPSKVDPPATNASMSGESKWKPLPAASSLSESGNQQNEDVSGKLWDQAYDEIEEKEDKLVEAYLTALTAALGEKKAGDASGTVNISAKLKDRTKRRELLEMLMKNGKKRVEMQVKISAGVGNVAETILKVKPFMEDIVLKIPQASPAALPWAGVCIGLTVRNSLRMLYLEIL